MPQEPESLEDLLKEGKSSYKKSDFQMAISYFDKAIALEPDNAEALFYRKRSVSKLQEMGGTVSEDTSVADTASIASSTSNTLTAETAAAQAPPSGDFKGDPNCASCNGSGVCRWCKGGACYWCGGNGQCDKCKGTGVTKGQQCPSCAGSGKCHSCKGSGQCFWCHGNGRCSKCGK
jgi:hypothetical protein